MKRAPKDKKSSFDIDRFIGGAATVQADTAPAVEEAPASEPAASATEAPAPVAEGPVAKTTSKKTTGAKSSPAKPKRAARAKTAKKSAPPPEPEAPDMIRTSFDLPKSLQKRLKVGAVIKGVPMRDLVEDAIRQYLDREGMPEAP